MARCFPCSCSLGWVVVAVAGAAAVGWSLTRDDATKGTSTDTTLRDDDAKPAQTKPTKASDEKAQSSDPAPAIPKVDPYVLGHSVQDIDGVTQDLSQYKGKVVLIVNVASKCGFTPQYKGLQKLYDENKDKGLVVLGFPANNFRGQEPGTNSEIKEFCTKDYSVTFPMFAKISVVGDDQHPLFKQLAQLSQPPSWNFNKYLVDRNGNFVKWYDSRVKPEDSELSIKIRELLETK